MFTFLLEKRNKTFLWVYAGTTTICCVVSPVFFTTSEQLGFYLSQVLFFLIFIWLTVCVQIFFWRKNTALLLSLNVLKWPFLIYIVYKMTKLVELEMLPFFLGVSPFILSALIWSLFMQATDRAG